jgi:hypothetical protein
MGYLGFKYRGFGRGYNGSKTEPETETKIISAAV